MLPNSISFSIENQLNPLTNQPFGSKYSGTFNIRRASIRDKARAGYKAAAERNAFGVVGQGEIAEDLEAATYMFYYVETLASEDLPAWFKLDNLFDANDESALFKVWQEVQTFQNMFREGKSGGEGTGAGQQPSVPIPAPLQVTA